MDPSTEACHTCGQAVVKKLAVVEDIAVTKFREYIRIKTEQPNPDYEACKDFLLKLAGELGIETKVIYTSPKTPFVLMSIPGRQPELSSVLLLSHTDVVPASTEHWKHDPYAAHKEENGDIYGRGTQDMKSVGAQHFEAIRRHFLKGKKQWERTIHILWAPEEETGTEHGMVKFVTMDEFRALNVRFALNEGGPSDNGVYAACYAERTALFVKVTCEGSRGHGSKFMEDTASAKLQSFIQNALAYREVHRKRMIDEKLTLGDTLTLNLTVVSGGNQINWMPEKLVAYFDIRVTPLMDYLEVESRLSKWCQKAGTGVTFQLLSNTKVSDDVTTVDIKSLRKDMTPTGADDAWWTTFEGALKAEGCDFKKEILTAATDSRHLRKLGIRAIGFSPMINTPVRPHDHNEFINEAVFLRGVAIYETIIDRLASAQHK